MGGLIGSFIGVGGISGFDLRSFLIAIAGSLLLLYAYRLVKRRA